VDNVISPMFEDYKGIMLYPDRTICEVHKEIYDILVLIGQDNPKLLELVLPLLEEAYEMGVKLCLKLTEYKCDLSWEENSDETRALRVLRLLLNHKKKELEQFAEKRKRPNNFLKQILEQVKVDTGIRI